MREQVEPLGCTFDEHGERVTRIRQVARGFRAHRFNCIGGPLRKPVNAAVNIHRLVDVVIIQRLQHRRRLQCRRSGIEIHETRVGLKEGKVIPEVLVHVPEEDNENFSFWPV